MYLLHIKSTAFLFPWRSWALDGGTAGGGEMLEAMHLIQPPNFEAES